MIEMPDMNMYDVEMSTRGSSPQRAKLLVMAVDQASADAWAEAHAKANDLDLIAKTSGRITDTAKWVKDNGPSVDLATTRPGQTPDTKAAGR
jgi:hypothetical protein